MAIKVQSMETPTTIVVGELPMSTPIASTFLLNPQWQQWMSSIATWVTKSQAVTRGKLTDDLKVEYGDYICVRSGNLVTVQGTLVAGTYNTISLLGIPVPPASDALIHFNGTTGVLSMESVLSVAITSTATINFSGTYIALKEKFVKE
jgi:hypothetical protein